MNDAFAPMRSLHFRHVPEGWLYRSPNLWIFSRPDHYIVNEAQKAAIEQFLPRASKPTTQRILIWTSAFIAVLAAVLGAAFLVAPDFPVTAITTLTAVTLVGSIFALHLSAKSQLRRLQPILANAMRTDQTITVAEMQRHLEAGVSYAQARRGGFVSAFAAIGMLAFVAVSLFLRQKNGWPIAETTVKMFVLYALMMGLSSASSFRRAHVIKCETNGVPSPEATSRALLLGRMTQAFAIGAAVYLVALAANSIVGEFSALSQGRRYEAKGDHDKALASFSNAVESDPNSAAAYTARAKIYAARKDNDHAIADYTKAIAIQPANLGAYRDRASAYRANNNFTAAVADYTKVIELDPSNAFAYLFRGHSHADLKNKAAAIADFSKSITIDPKDPYGYLARARALEASGDRAQAMADANKAIELNPKLANAYRFRAGLHSASKQNKNAIADYSRAIEIEPGLKYNYISRALLFQAANDYDRAATDCTKAIDIDPNYDGAYIVRGGIRQLKKEFDLAIGDYTAAIRIAPDSISPFVSRASLYVYKGAYDLAITDYKRILELPATNARDRQAKEKAPGEIERLTAERAAHSK